MVELEYAPRGNDLARAKATRRATLIPTKGLPAQPWDFPSHERGLEAQHVQLSLNLSWRQELASDVRLALPCPNQANTGSRLLVTACLADPNGSVSKCFSLNHS